MWYQMCLVDQHQVPRTEPGGVAPHALHPGENDRRVPFALADARAVDADGRVRPQREEGVEILLDQFKHMVHDQNSQCWIATRNIADQVRDHDALAGRGRHRCERIAATLRPVSLQRRERLFLVWPKFEHDLVSGRCPLLKGDPGDTGQFPHQRCACQGAGPAGLLGAAVTVAALVAGIAGLVGSGSAGFVSSGIMRETRFLSG